MTTIKTVFLRNTQTSLSNLVGKNEREIEVF